VKVVYACSLSAGGPVTHLLDLAPHVAGLGVEVRVICADEPVAEAFRAAGVEATVRPLRHKLDLAGARRIWPELRGADVLHTHDRRTGLLARPQARLARIRAVHTLHGVPDEIFGFVGRDDGSAPPGTSRLQLLWLRHGLLRIEAWLSRLSVVVVPSHALASFLAENGFPAERLVVIHNGVTLRRVGPGPAHDPPRVGTAAILEYRKGIDVLVDACARTAKALRLEIFGDGSLREQLASQAERAGVAATLHCRADQLADRVADRDRDYVAYAD